MELEGWNEHVKTLATMSLRNSCALLNPQVIHNLFGDPAKKQYYRVYFVKELTTIGEKVNFRISGSYQPSLDLVFAEVQKIQPQHCWYYLPDKKYILYVEGQNLLCVDYGHFDDAQTLVIEFLKLPWHPLDRLSDLELMINNCHDFVQVVRERQQLLAMHSSVTLLNPTTSKPRDFDVSRCCKQCFKTAEKTLIACSRCQAAYYCDRTCQGKDFAKHKLDCVQITVKEVPDE